MPVRSRLTLWYGTALAAILLVFAVVLYTVMARSLRAQVDESLRETAAVAIESLEQHRFGPFLVFRDLSQDFPQLAVLNKFFQIFGPAGAITIQSPNLGNQKIPLSDQALEAAYQGRSTLETTYLREGVPVRLLTMPVAHGGSLVNIVQVGTSLDSVEETLDRLLFILWLTVPVALLAALGGGWLIAGKALRPVETITSAARRIAQGDLSQRLAEPQASDEIGRLAATFNQMIGRLESSFRQVRQFSMDASHELKTPLTVMKGETELALRRERPAEQYREALESNLEEIDRMSHVVDELLFLSRADMGEVQTEAKEVSLHTLVEDVYRQAAVLAQERQVQVHLGSLAHAVIIGDELRLRELLLNLLSNAVKYSKPGGNVTLSLVHQDAKVILTVEDEGIGIPPEERARIFDRFYRTEGARAHAKQGTGLGLSICSWIAKAHHGAITVDSMEGKGSVFRVSFPSEPNPHEAQRSRR